LGITIRSAARVNWKKFQPGYWILLSHPANWNVPGLTIVTLNNPVITYHNWKRKAIGFGEENKTPLNVLPTEHTEDTENKRVPEP